MIIEWSKEVGLTIIISEASQISLSDLNEQQASQQSSVHDYQPLQQIEEEKGEVMMAPLRPEIEVMDAKLSKDSSADLTDYDDLLCMELCSDQTKQFLIENNIL